MQLENMTRLIKSALLALLVLCFVAPAAAASTDEQRARARELAYRGQEQFQAKDFKGALASFQEANSLVPAPTLLLGVARAQVGLGRYAEAYRNYEEILERGQRPDDPTPFKRAVKDAEQESAQVEAQLGWVRVEVRGVAEEDADELRVTLDGRSILVTELSAAHPVDPGVHQLRASAPGYQAGEGSITVARGERPAPVILELEALPPPVATVVPAPAERSPEADTAKDSGLSKRSWAYITLGAGAAGIVTGAVFGIVAINKHGDLDKVKDDPSKCLKTRDGYVCNGDPGGMISEYETAGAIATVGFVAGGALLGAGAYLLFTADDPKEFGASSSKTTSASRKGRERGLTVQPYIGFAALGATGSF